MKHEDLVTLFTTNRFSFRTEAELQDGIDLVLRGANLSTRREVSVGADRIDFMVGKVGIEIKTDSSTSSVLRQLYRYAKQPNIESLVLVTTRSKHKQLPAELYGKPVTVVHLIGSAL